MEKSVPMVPSPPAMVQTPENMQDNESHNLKKKFNALKLKESIRQDSKTPKSQGYDSVRPVSHTAAAARKTQRRIKAIQRLQGMGRTQRNAQQNQYNRLIELDRQFNS